MILVLDEGDSAAGLGLGDLEDWPEGGFGLDKGKHLEDPHYTEYVAPLGSGAQSGLD